MAKGNTVRKERKGRPSINTSRPRTRGQRPKLHDPVANTAELTAQLRSLGLYAAPTLGDGNCLFRALSDQIYGTPNQHLSLRVEVCEFMASHKDRFEAFVDDDQGLDRHLSAMRSNGTYGGHLELTAFAQLKLVNVKVVQPGLVYVIEGSGTDFFGGARSEPPAGGGGEEGPSTSREKRKAKKERRLKKAEVDDDDDDEQQAPFPATVYVAYHDWEHFSSVRNLTGPHQGMPNVREVPPPDTLPSPPPSKSNTTPAAPISTKSSRMKPKHPQPQPTTPDSDSDSPSPLTPPPPIQPPTITETTVARSPKRAIPDDDDEPSESSSRLKRGRRGTITSAMRTKSRKYVVDKEEDMDDIFSDVLPESGFGSGSGSGVRSVTSASDAAGSFVSDAPPPPPPAPMVEEDLDVDVDGDEEEEEEERSKALTKKQRKSLPATKGKGKAAARASTGSVNAKAAAKAAAGPKSSARAATKPPARARASTGTVTSKAAKAAAAKGAGAGESEGGSRKRETRSATKVHRDAGRVRDLGTGEWLDNGTGRLDVRGFRELRI